MPIHDWTASKREFFTTFIIPGSKNFSTLNAGLLPADYYAMQEQHAAGFGPDVLTLQGSGKGNSSGSAATEAAGGVGLLLAPPKVHLTAETDMEFYLCKQNTIAVRHVSGDRVVAMLEVVSSGNKMSRHALPRSSRKPPSYSKTGFICCSSICIRPARATRTASTGRFGKRSRAKILVRLRENR